MSATQVTVIAKAPQAGRSKTRLSPPCTPGQAAALARAALEDTLAAVAATAVDRRVLVLDGEPGAWLPDGFAVVPQRAGAFGERLAGAFFDGGAPALLVGMDTPQLTPALLRAGLDALHAPGVDAVLGLAEDGGYWAIGLRAARADVFAGVPMSTERTGAAQVARLAALGLRVAALPALRDVDVIADARALAAAHPATRFGALVRELGLAGEAAA